MMLKAAFDLSAIRPEPRTCMFLGCDNLLPTNQPWPVDWCEECNDKRRKGRELPEYPPCLVCGQPTDGPVICDECDSNFDQADGDE